jgi:hypothetical protein
MTVPVGDAPEYMGALSGEKVPVNNGCIQVNIKANSGEIWVPVCKGDKKSAAGKPEVVKEAGKVSGKISEPKPEKIKETKKAKAEPSKDKKKEEKPAESSAPVQPVQEEKAKGSYEDGVIDGLQEAIIAIMEKNGYVTDQMRNDVYNNRHHESLVNWVKSFIH